MDVFSVIIDRLNELLLSSPEMEICSVLDLVSSITHFMQAIKMSDIGFYDAKPQIQSETELFLNDFFSNTYDDSGLILDSEEFIPILSSFTLDLMSESLLTESYTILTKYFADYSHNQLLLTCSTLVLHTLFHKKTFDEEEYDDGESSMNAFTDLCTQSIQDQSEIILHKVATYSSDLTG